MIMMQLVTGIMYCRPVNVGSAEWRIGWSCLKRVLLEQHI